VLVSASGHPRTACGLQPSDNGAAEPSSITARPARTMPVAAREYCAPSIAAVMAAIDWTRAGLALGTLALVLRPNVNLGEMGNSGMCKARVLKFPAKFGWLLGQSITPEAQRPCFCADPLSIRPRASRGLPTRGGDTLSVSGRVFDQFSWGGATVAAGRFPSY